MATITDFLLKHKYAVTLQKVDSSTFRLEIPAFFEVPSVTILYKIKKDSLFIETYKNNKLIETMQYKGPDYTLGCMIIFDTALWCETINYSIGSMLFLDKNGKLTSELDCFEEMNSNVNPKKLSAIISILPYLKNNTHQQEDVQTIIKHYQIVKGYRALLKAIGE